MTTWWCLLLSQVACAIAVAPRAWAQGPPEAPLPPGVKAVWDLTGAYREITPARERVCINGLWRWQPARDAADAPPSGNWGYFKVPGCWPGITDYMQKDCQTVYTHPRWTDQKLDELTVAWYQREITLPSYWTGRRIALSVEYLNSYAVVFVDGRRAGAIRFPAGEADLTGICRPGRTHVLSLLVIAMPLKSVMLSFRDTNSAREGRGSVQRRGLCGDVFLTSTPRIARLHDVRVNTSVRNWQITFSAGLEALAVSARYALRARITEDGRLVREFTGKPFTAGEVKNGRIALTATWKPEKLWDIHTPRNQYQVRLSLLDTGGKALDTSYPVRFGFREFWIHGRDFYLNGSRIFLSALPLDNAEIGAALASYEGAKESLLRLKSIGINFVYTHNYGCEPGSHLSFAEVLRAADDVGILVSLSQPHFAQYDWRAPDADQTNGYACHAAFYVRVAGSHPSVVFYSMSHNATGYSDDMNPDMIDGVQAPRESWALNNVTLAVRAEAIVARLDPARIVYHHSSGNLGSMHTSNFYTNFAPIQELDDWLEHWATSGVKPFFTCEYMVPCTWDWTMYRGWYKGGREFGSAVVPWDFSVAEWSAQFLGDRAYRIGEAQKTNIRWEAKQYREGRLWHRWDYPHPVGDRVFEEQHTIIGRYLTDNWRAFRTWGLSANSPWEHHFFWSPRPGVDRSRKELKVDWENLQRPGFSPDYIGEQYERMDLAFQRSDWLPTADGRAILRNNRPLLAYIAGKPSAFTSKDHNFMPGETVEKQLIVINNSRETVTCRCSWSLGLPQRVTGEKKVVVATGSQERIPMRFALPEGLGGGRYEINTQVRFSTGETQKDTFIVHVMPHPKAPGAVGRVALFDPKGETGKLLDGLGVPYRSVDAGADLVGYDILVVGKGALTVEGPAPDMSRVRVGLKVCVFEQTSQVLEKRLGFRVAEYGLRQVFKRVPDHPLLSGLDAECLRDWRGDATLLSLRLKYALSPRLAYTPAVEWCGIEVSHVWRCGNRGNVASVLIEKPACGDFLPILDGGYSLQYSPLMEYREGQGMILFCQMDLNGRAETDPAARTLAANMVAYLSHWQPARSRKAVYVGAPEGRNHLEAAGVALADYQDGKLSDDDVLIVGTGGGRQLGANAAAVADFLKAGGQVMALGLEEQEANAFLPFHVGMRKEEHLAAYFEAPGVHSPFVGVCPADVHNRDPRALPLVSGGAAAIGDGVLASAQNGNVVFCQLTPYGISKAQGAAPSLRVDGEDAAEGKQSALLTLGSVTGQGAQFGQKVAGGEAGKTYTFAVFARGVGGPVRAHLEIERPVNPWDRAVNAQDVLISENAWTEVHTTFQVERPFPEGWFAYLSCAQEGARLRVDGFRIYEGEYVPAKAPEAEMPRNLFANPGFEAGTESWQFLYHEQFNVRKTYRRASFLLTRLLANRGVAGSTPLLARFATPAGGASQESMLKNGDLLPDAERGGIPDHWQFITDRKQATCAIEGEAAPTARRCLRITSPAAGEGGQGDVMLAQQDVPVAGGQWYLLSLKARWEGSRGAQVSLALQNTTTWQSLFEYQRFAPTGTWDEFTFRVQANATATSGTRFQIWHSNPGTLWLADIRMTPCDPPSVGRWTGGLYLDQPEEWDDPYRFFRW